MSCITLLWSFSSATTTICLFRTKLKCISFVGLWNQKTSDLKTNVQPLFSSVSSSYNTVWHNRVILKNGNGEMCDIMFKTLSSATLKKTMTMFCKTVFLWEKQISFWLKFVSYFNLKEQVTSFVGYCVRYCVHLFTRQSFSTSSVCVPPSPPSWSLKNKPERLKI